MCFVIFICCNACNNYSSKCVEFFIFIMSFLSFITSNIALFILNKNNLNFLCLLLLIAFIFFSFIILFFICIILIFRFKQTINNKHNKTAIIFSIIALLIAITFLICVISEVSLIHNHYIDINHPCLDIKKSNDIFNSRSIIDENMHEFCKHNKNYNSHEIPTKDFFIAYGFTAIFISFILCLIYSWFNEYRRIKYLINGSLNDFKIQENKKDNNNIEEEIERYNKEIENKNNNSNNNEVDKELDNNNDLKKEETKKKLDKKITEEGITIYSNKNNRNKIFEGSSDIMLTESNTKKINVKKKKKNF